MTNIGILIILEEGKIKEVVTNNADAIDVIVLNVSAKEDEPKLTFPFPTELPSSEIESKINKYND